MRVTNNITAQRLLANIQRNQQSVATLQEILSTGRKFRLPEQNPISYVESLNLRQELAENRRYQRNLTLSRAGMDLTESTLSTVNDSMQRARQLALQGANGSLSAGSRGAVADEIEQILSTVIQQANANFEGRFIFSGDKTLTTPFERFVGGDGLDAVAYRGDFGDRLIEINQGDFLAANLTGPDVFFTSLNEIKAAATVTATNLLATELAAAAPPVAGGTFVVDGVAITYDPLTDSLESLRDKINRSVTTAEADIDSNGRLRIRSLTSNDVQLQNGTSNVLEVLGMYHQVTGSSIGAGITAATTLASLGITGDALSIQVGDDEYQVNLAGAATVGDVITAVAASGAPVEAFINASGTGINFSATESVDSLEMTSLRKIFGSSALGSGAVTLDASLASLGILAPGQLQITNEGATTTLDLSGATTVADLIQAINTQVNGVVASINADGSAIDLESDFFSTTLSAVDLGGSNIAAVLGFAQNRTGDNAADFGISNPGTVDETESQNIFRSLAEMIQVLRSPTSTSEDFSRVLDSFDADIATVLSNRSIIGARVNRVEASQNRLEAFESFLTELLSENEDADLAETITQLSTQANVLNAALTAGAQLLQPSLIDFLR